MTFKLGRRPGVIPAGLRDLTYYVAGTLPAAPAAIGVPQVSPNPDGTLWGLLGNAEKGDCGVAGLEHGFMADACIAALAETPATADQAISYYLNYTGGQDDGVILSSYLASVRTNGYYGRTISAYAPVAVNDVPTLQFSIWAYGFTYTGITVTQAMMDAVEGGTWQPWTTDMAQGAPIGGHCIPLVGYDDQYLYAVTWGQVQKISYPAWHVMAAEAWAVITGEFVSAGGDARGVSLSALTADLDQIGA
jgi:hypothetical protein